VLTATVLHAGILHLGMNMLMLMRLGINMEETFGTPRVCIIYVGSGVFGMIISAIFLPTSVTTGASASLFGLVGALFGDFIQNHRIMVEGKWPYFIQLCVSTIIGLVVGLLPGVCPSLLDLL